MKAIVCTAYGAPEVLQMQEIEKPVPKDNEVLVNIKATTAHAGDSRIRRSSPFLVVRVIYGLFKPKKNLVLGIEISGYVESVGKDVTTFKPGDAVFGLTGIKLGGYSEYCCIPEKVKDGKQEIKGVLLKVPQNIDLETAATIPSASLTALKNFQRGKIKPGDKVLINGASGSLGTYAIQLAKHFGAEVTAVCSTRNFKLVTSLGADKVIDYTKEDFTEGNQQYDIVYDAVMKLSKRKCKKVLKENGTYQNNYWLPSIKEEDFKYINNLIVTEKLKPYIDSIYTIENIVEAHKYLDTERKRGNIIVTV